MVLQDATRDRSIPIAIHAPRIEPKRLVILSHGYAANRPGTYLRYSYLTKSLTEAGNAVVSIQHELPDDPLLAMKGNLREARRPNWERGVENIVHVLERIRTDRPEWASLPVLLIGHSNGGDMSLLFAELHPERIEAVITLDNLRMPLPRTSKPHIATIRANDTTADSGVLPTDVERNTFGIRVVRQELCAHVEMDDRATEAQRAELSKLVLELIEGM
ncbi:MAG: alpha/beta hydrolase [Flavobacteriales bacterium]